MRLFMAHLPPGVVKESWIRRLFPPFSVTEVWIVGTKNIAFVEVSDEIGKWAIRTLDRTTFPDYEGYPIVVTEAKERLKRIDVRAMRMAAIEKGGVDITQQQAADIVAVSLRTWQRWETGDRKLIPPGPVKLFCSQTNLFFDDWNPLVDG